MLGITTLSKWQCGALGFCLSLSSIVHADISGNVFRDFNANGSFDNTPSFAELGVTGVTVKAVDSAGAVAATTSTASGAYTLTGLTAGAPYRLEFTWAETWLKPGVAGGTSTQFVKDGVNNADLALSSPDEYSQDNPQIAISNSLVGEPTDPKVAGKPGVLEFAYRSGAAGRSFPVAEDAALILVDEVTPIAISSAPSSLGTGNAAPVSMVGHSKIVNATLDQIGPIYGLAYHRNANQLLAASFMKRFAGFPGGASNSKLGTIYKIDRNSNPNAVSSFFTANAGIDSHDYSNTNLGSPTGDLVAGNQAAKAGWGDIDLSSNGKILYAINLFDKEIYAIPVIDSGSSLTAGSAIKISFPSSVTDGLCSNNDWIPGGIKTYRDDVYVTVTCTAETSQSVNDLKFFVYKFPQGSDSPFIQVVSMSAPERDNGLFNQQWRPWTNTNTLNGTIGVIDQPNRYIYPQPWAMDIEFDEFGKLYLGIRNRSSDMRAALNDTGQFSFEYGDTQVGVPSLNGSYTMLASINPAPYEFIDDATTTAAADYHPENDMGALAVIAGTKEIIVPANIGNFIQGMRTYSTVDATTTTAKSGIPLRYYGITQGTRTDNTAGSTFGKMAGLGDLEVLAAPAPIEVGNRVWVDKDKDGIQDADESGLSGVVVDLVCATHKATATSDTNGQFIFTNANGGNASFMQAEANCSLSIDNTQAVLKGYQLTAANADSDSSNSALTDLRDSDAVSNINVAELNFILGNAGENNHSLDFGYLEPVITDISVTKAVAPTQAKQGDHVVYTLTAINQSQTTAATNVKIVDQLPAAVTYLSDDGGAQYGADVFDEVTGVWAVGIIDAGKSKVLNITVSIN